VKDMCGGPAFRVWVLDRVLGKFVCGLSTLGGSSYYGGLRFLVGW